MPASNGHSWVSAEDILEWRRRAVRKTIECWVPCYGETPKNGKGSTPVMLSFEEVLDDPDNPAFP